MAQQHILNGSNVSYVSQAIWRDAPTMGALSGHPTIQRWRTHLWRADSMTITEFDILQGLEGAHVVLDTTAYDDPNADDYLTFYDAILQRVQGTQQANIAHNVTLEFLVKV